MTSTMLLLLLIVSVVLLAYANGANDNFKATATLFGSSTLTYRSALVLATLAQLCGSVASVVLAAALLKAFGGKGLIPDGVLGDSRFLIAVGLGAAGTVLVATRMGLPISTTHSMIGGLVGASLALMPTELLWTNLGNRFLVPLLISPGLAVIAAAVIYPPASRLRKRAGIDDVTCLCIAESVEEVALTRDGSMVIARTGLQLTVDEQAHCEQRYGGRVVGVSAQRLVDTLHVTSGFALGFARGLNDTPKVLALLVAASWSGLDMRVSLAIVAIVMAAGGVLHSRRIANTLGKRITEINRGQGFIANFVASALVIGASVIGSPVSTTHVSTGAIFGIGLWTGKANWRVVGEIIMAWVATLPVGALLAFVAAKSIGAV